MFEPDVHHLPKKLSVTLAALLLAISGCGGGQTGTATASPKLQNLQSLVNQPPDAAGLGFLLTDGTVMFQGAGLSDWPKLTPDISGSYLNGTWSQLASQPAGYSPEDYASATLADGRVVITGGEYNLGTFVLTNLGAIYDPVADAWTSLAPQPAGTISEIRRRSCCPMVNFWWGKKSIPSWRNWIPALYSGRRWHRQARAISMPKKVGRFCPMARS